MIVAGIISHRALLAANVVASPAVLDAGGVAPVDSIVLVAQEAGADTAALTGGIQAALAALPTVTLQDTAAFADGQWASIDHIAVLSIPWTELVVFVVLAGLVGVLAAVFPARRAARMGVLRAITAQ